MPPSHRKKYKGDEEQMRSTRWLDGRKKNRFVLEIGLAGHFRYVRFTPWSMSWVMYVKLNLCLNVCMYVCISVCLDKGVYTTPDTRTPGTPIHQMNYD